MSQVLITGATGFIGSRLCRSVAERGHDIRALKREHSITDHLSDLDIDWMVGDLLDPESIHSAARGCDYVFHLAGISLKNAGPETVHQVNVEGTKHVLDACVEEGVDRLVYTSSAGALGTDGIVDETDDPTLIGAYQQSKAEAENTVRDYVDSGLDAVIVNPTTVFGPGDEKFTERMLRLATTPKLFAYFPGGANIVSVRDVADGHVDALEHGVPGERYILGGDNLEYGEALEIIASKANGSKPPIKIPATVIHLLGPFAGLLDQYFDKKVFPFNSEMAHMATDKRFYSSEKAKRELGYSPTPFEEHVEEAIEWYLNEYLD